MSFVLSCCSTADLSKAHFEERGIRYICFHFALDGVDFPDDLGRSIAFPDFYKAMADGAETRTSQVNVSEFEEYFSRFAAEGKDVLHVTLSSGISGVIPRPQGRDPRLPRRVLGLRSVHGRAGRSARRGNAV